MFLIFIFDLFSCRCGDFFMCEGAIEGVVEMSFFSCYFQSCLLALMCLLAVIFFPGKLYAGSEVVVWRCGVIL